MQRVISPNAARSKPTAEPKPCLTCARIRAEIADSNMESVATSNACITMVRIASSICCKVAWLDRKSVV